MLSSFEGNLPGGNPLSVVVTKAPFYGAFLFLVVGCVLLNTASMAIASAAVGSETARVRHVIDGDTVVLQSGEKVRLLGINAPEKASDRQSAQPYSLEALLTLRELVEDRNVQVIAGQQNRDRYGRLLAYLETSDGVDVQQVLLRRGYAFATAFPPDIDRLEDYLKAEWAARREKIGVWQQDVTNIFDLSKHYQGEIGFGLFSGKIVSVKTSARNVRLLFDGNIVVTISQDAWAAFWTGPPQGIRGQQVEARGWLTRARGTNSNNSYYLKVRHPSMLKPKSYE